MPKLIDFEFAAESSWDNADAVADSAVGNVLVVGDIHGSTSDLQSAASEAKQAGTQAIVQLGDFWLADRWGGGGASAKSSPPT